MKKENVFKKINSRPKQSAFIFFLASTVFFVVLLPFFNEMPFRVFAALLIGAGIIVSLTMLFKGVATAIRYLLICYSFIFAVAAATILNLKISLPEYFSPNAFLLLTLVPWVVCMTAEIPKRVSGFVVKRLGGSAPEEPEQNEKITYAEYAELSRIAAYGRKPYSLSNCSPESITRRKVAAIIMAVFTFLSFIAMVLLNLWNYIFVFVVVAMIAVTVTIYRAGFFRAFAVLIFSMTLLFVGSLFYSSVLDSPREKLAVWILLFAVLAAAIVFLSMHVVKRQKENLLDALISFERENIFFGTDMLFSDVMPVKNYETLQVVSMTGSPLSMKTAGFSAELMSFAKKRKMIFAGFFCGREEPGEYKAFIYSNGEAAGQIEKFFKGSNKAFCIETFEDDEGRLFKKWLLPNQYEIAEMKNKNSLRMLEEEGFDFSRKAKEGFLIYFSDKSSSEEFVEEAKKRSYVDVCSVGHELGVRGNGGIQAELIQICVVGKAGLERLNLNSKNVIDFAERYGGELIEIGFKETE